MKELEKSSFKVIALVTFCFIGLFSNTSFSQGRLVLNNNSYLVIDNSAFVVIDNNATNAITTLTGGNIVSEAEADVVKWNIGTATGSYTIPFSNASGTKIPLNINIGSAGAGATNSVLFSTYGGAWDNDGYKPSDVTNLFGSTPTTTNNSAYVIDRFWIIDASSYTTKPSLSDISFAYIDAEWSAASNLISSAGGEGSLRPQRFNSSTNSWMGFNGVGPINTAANTVSSGSVSPANFFKSWTLADNTSPLPIELLYFKGNCNKNSVLLSWATASEKDNSFFTVERSIDGVNFISVGNVNSKALNGNSSQQLSYTFVDQTAIVGITYYRLKQTDFDGSSETSTVISIECSEGAKPSQNVHVYPNPSQGNFNLSLQGFTDKVEIAVYDVLGQIIKEFTPSLYAKEQVVNIDLEHESIGVYFIVINSEFGYNKKIKIINTERTSRD